MARIVTKVLYPNEVNFQQQYAEVPAQAAIKYLSSLWDSLPPEHRASAKFYGMDNVRITFEAPQTPAEEKQEKLDKARNYLLSLGRNSASPEDIATILSFLQ